MSTGTRRISQVTMGSLAADQDNRTASDKGIAACGDNAFRGGVSGYSGKRRRSGLRVVPSQEWR